MPSPTDVHVEKKNRNLSRISTTPGETQIELRMLFGRLGCSGGLKSLLTRTVPLFGPSPSLLATSHPLVSQTRSMAIANFRPKKLAHKKSMKGFYRSRAGGSLRGTTVYHGDYALQVTEGGRLFDRQLDTARNMVRRIIKQDKGSKFILSQFPHRPVTSKGAETRMGKGKGVVEHFATWMRTGSIVFEVKGARTEIARRALRAAAGTLPLRSRIIKANPDMRVAPRCLPHFIMKSLHQAEFTKALVADDASKDSLKKTAKLEMTKE